MSATPEKMIEQIMAASLTPLTDEAAHTNHESFDGHTCECVDADFARKLELRMHTAEDALEDLEAWLPRIMTYSECEGELEDACGNALNVIGRFKNKEKA